jgi:hypothetical protein
MNQQCMQAETKVSHPVWRHVLPFTWAFCMMFLLVSGASWAAESDQAQQEKEFRKRVPVLYSEIRRPVRVKLDKDFSPGTINPRPKGFFQLAGAHNKKLCAEVLKAFTQQSVI